MQHRASSDADSIRTSLPRHSPTPSIVSTTILTPDGDDDDGDEPPPYSSTADEPAAAAPASSWTNRDPRSASTQSLVPDSHEAAASDKRRLLLVYVHGFMGSETSFQSFPAHVHNLVAILLAESHVVHTKVYPRYRAKKTLAVAAEQLSQWLQPHEDPETDIILLGHSMGGLLAADTVLLQPSQSPLPQGPLKHQGIIGTISFDVPFLGMHPGVIASGISSLFRPAEKPQRSPQVETANPLSPVSSVTSLSRASSSSLSDVRSSTPQDPNYNPAFSNDVHLPVRPGWRNAAHFINKHSKNLRQATKNLVASHLEFGGALADFDGLKTRYSRIRMLEEELEKSRLTIVNGEIAPSRVRFVNYYTACGGRPKPVTPGPSSEQTPQQEAAAADSKSLSAPVTQRPVDESAELASLPPSYSDIEFTDSESEVEDLEDLERLDPIDSSDVFEPAQEDQPVPGQVRRIETGDPDYQPLPSNALPAPPVFKPPFGALRDKEAYKAAFKEYRKQVKEYHRQIITYHHAMMDFRRQEVQRLKTYHKTSRENLQATLDARRAEITGRREQRRAEFEARREKLKQRIDEAKDRRNLEREMRSAAKSSLCGKDRKEAKHDRKETKKEGKMERKFEKHINKDEHKLNKKIGRSEARQLKKDIRRAKRGQEGDDADRDVEYDQEDAETFFDQDYEQESDSEIAPEDSASGVGHQDVKSSMPTQAEYPPEKGKATRAAAPPPLPPRQASLVSTEATPAAATADTLNEKNQSATKPKKDRKFCNLPPKDATGARDPTWVRVYMEGVDEVGAHCGLFFPRGAENQEPTNGDVGEAGTPAEDAWSDRYAGMVGDVAERVEQWVHDSMTERLVRAVGGL